MEHYFMSRLYIPSRNYNLVLQSEISNQNNNINTYTDIDAINSIPHRFHILMQNRLNLFTNNRGTTDIVLINGPTARPSIVPGSIRGATISHWASNMDNLNRNLRYSYRKARSTRRDIFITYPVINILLNRREYLISFIYSLIDYYWAFMDKQENRTLLNNNFNSPGNRSYPKILMHYYLNTILPILDNGINLRNQVIPPQYTAYISNFNR
jgi:hypothetical protein